MKANWHDPSKQAQISKLTKAEVIFENVEKLAGHAIAVTVIRQHQVRKP